MNRDDTASDLITTAQRAALAEITRRGTVNPEATPRNLQRLAALVKKYIGLQVLAGTWSALNVTDPTDFAALRIAARPGNQLVGESPIVLEYDFSRTRLKLLQVAPAKAVV